MCSKNSDWLPRLAGFFTLFLEVVVLWFMKHLRCAMVCILTIYLGWPCPSQAYSVLTHEAIIDAAWDTNIRPLLLARFPAATRDELRSAHAYAYGGAIIQDMGYYPHGNKFFSDLTHYFRSGDFIEALLHDSQDLNDYAFAIGAMAHYAADNSGHRLATNLAVPMLYPELTYVLKNQARVINSYRHDVSSLIPEATRVAWKLKQDDIQKDLPGMTRKKFL